MLIWQADLDKPASLDLAVAGAYAVFAVTNCKCSKLRSCFDFSADKTLEYKSLGETGPRCRNRPRKGYCRRSRCRGSFTPHLVIASTYWEDDERRINFALLG
jgi:hypothetical protein